MSTYSGAPQEPRRIRFDPTQVRRADAYESADRHSTRVRWLKFVLPALALAAVGAFAYTMRFAQSEVEQIVSSAGINVEEKSLVMQAPHISGFEGTHQAYEVKAARATQNLETPKMVQLEEISAHFGMAGDATATVSAANGIFNGYKNQLLLNGGITLKTSDGYQAQLENVAIGIDEGTLYSDKPLEIRTTDGVIRANLFGVADRGKRIYFGKGVSVTFNPPAAGAADVGPIRGSTAPEKAVTE